MRTSLIIPILLVASLGLSGCSEKSEPAAGAKNGATVQPSPSDGPPPGKADIAYFDCLKKNGLAVETTDAASRARPRPTRPTRSPRPRRRARP